MVNRQHLKQATMPRMTLSMASWVWLVCCVMSDRSTPRPDTWPDVYESRQLTLLKQIRAAVHALERRLEETDRNKDTFCREIYEGHHETRACYKLVRAEVTWSQARAYCRSLAPDADLVSIESEVEQIYLVDAILGSQHPCERFHTSGRKEDSGRWVWQATGRPFNYTAWAPTEPSGNGNLCVLWERMQKWMMWDDEDATVSSCFICEMP